MNLDPAKLLVIFVVALVVLGPDRLPQAARQIGSVWRTLTHLREQVSEEVRRAIPEMDLPNLPRPGAVSSFITDLTRPPGNDRGADGANPVGRGATEATGGAVAPRVTTASGHGHGVFAPDDPSMN